jgi:hypothetical protein
VAQVTKKTQPLVQPGTVLHHYTQDEAAALVEQWLEAFGAERHGVNAKAYLWHVFSGSRYPSLSGAEAVAEYEKQIAVDYVVMSNDRKTAFATDALPQSSSLADYYVFPANLAWTMAFTHEDGWLGPYFARHGNFAALNEANHERVRKVHQAEAARLKGWR